MMNSEQYKLPLTLTLKLQLPTKEYTIRGQQVFILIVKHSFFLSERILLKTFLKSAENFHFQLPISEFAEVHQKFDENLG